MKKGHIDDDKKTYTPPESDIELMKAAEIMAGLTIDYDTGNDTEEALSNNSFWEYESKKGLWDDDE